MCIKSYWFNFVVLQELTWEKLALLENIECSCESEILIHVLIVYQGFITEGGGGVCGGGGGGGGGVGGWGVGWVGGWGGWWGGGGRVALESPLPPPEI